VFTAALRDLGQQSGGGGVGEAAFHARHEDDVLDVFVFRVVADALAFPTPMANGVLDNLPLREQL